MRVVRKLEDIRQDLAPLKAQGKVEGFFKNVKNADKLSGVVEDIRDAMIEYQVRIRKPTIPGVSDSYSRRRCSKISTIRVASSS